MKRKLMICILLSALFAVSLVSGLGQLPFKNAILLDEGVFNDFGIRLNDSFEVTGDINVSLVNDTLGNKNRNFFGYSSKTSINVDDVIFYKQDGTSLDYQDAKTNNWIVAINESNEGVEGDEATTLNEYRTYWVKSFLAVNMTFPNVGGSNISVSIPHGDLLFYNGTDYLFTVDAGTNGWIDTNIRYWEPTGGNSGTFRIIPTTKANLDTWLGHIIFSFKPTIYLLFENKTTPPQNIIVRYDDKTAVIPQNHIERFDDGTIEITVPKNIFMRFFRWIEKLA